jgi:hypothetical protein
MNSFQFLDIMPSLQGLHLFDIVGRSNRLASTTDITTIRMMKVMTLGDRGVGHRLY